MIFRNLQRSLWLLGLVFLGGCSVEVPEEIFRDGLEAIQKPPRNYIYAIVQFDKFLAKYPDHEYAPAALMQKARCHLALKQFDDALDTCDQLIARYPGTNWEVDGMFLKSELYESRGQWQKAIELCRKIQQSVTRVPRAYQEATWRLASAYIGSSSWAEAADVYAGMIESASIDPQLKPRLYVYRGRCLGEAGHPVQAQEVLRSLQELYPGTLESIQADIETAKMLAEIDPQASEQHLDMAVEAFRHWAAEPVAATAELDASSRALSTEGSADMTPGGLTPAQDREVQSVFMIADAYVYLGRAERAIEELESLKSRFPHNARVFQAASGLIQIIQQEQQKKGILDATAEQSVSVAPAAVGSVSP